MEVYNAYILELISLYGYVKLYYLYKIFIFAASWPLSPLYRTRAFCKIALIYIN